MKNNSLQKTKRKVLERIEKGRENIVKFLQDLIKYRSTLGEEKEIQEFIGDKLSQMGLDVDIWEPDIEAMKKHPAYTFDKELEKKGYRGRPLVVAVLKGKNKGKSLLLNGHVDVAPAEPLEKWTHDPWGAEIADGELYGRGASDMKGGVAAMIMAVDSILKEGVTLDGDITIESVIDEEQFDGAGTLACILRGYKADAGIILEPSGLNIVTACIGAARFRVRTKGKSIHPARKNEGVSALDKMIKIYHRIEQWDKYREATTKHPLIGQSGNENIVATVIGTMKSGVWCSIIPEEAEITCRVGFLPSESITEIQEKFKEEIRRVTVTDEWLRAHPPEVELMSYLEGIEVNLESPIVQVLEKECKQLDWQPKKIGLAGGSDLRLLVKYGQVPSVIFGSDYRNAHGIDESVSIESVISATKAVSLCILDWCTNENLESLFRKKDKFP